MVHFLLFRSETFVTREGSACSEGTPSSRVLGHIMTAMPAVNAIPGVVAARPGIVSYTDLALPAPRGLVRR